MSVEVKIVNNTIKISSPYDQGFVGAMRNMNGKWNSSDKTWNVDVDLLDEVREKLVEFYGESDLTNDFIDLWVTVPEDDYTLDALCAPSKMFGKVVAYATGRDSGAKWGEDVVNKNCKCDSGGSSRNWETQVRAGTFKIKKVSKSRFLADKEEYEEKGFTFEVIEKGIDEEALIKERAQLVDRIKEIDILLQK